jgi:hypothetical protein
MAIRAEDVIRVSNDVAAATNVGSQASSATISEVKRLHAIDEGGMAHEDDVVLTVNFRQLSQGVGKAAENREPEAIDPQPVAPSGARHSYL